MYQQILKAAESKNITISFVTAGGGVNLFEFFLVPGSSRVMGQAQMLYSKDSVLTFIGSPEDKEIKFVSQETSDRMAECLSQKSPSHISFAVTVALSTDRKRRGENKGFFTMYLGQEIVTQKEFFITAKARRGQDKAVGTYVTTILLAHIERYAP